MNKEDQYLFFLQKAITRPLHSDRKYFLHKSSQKLFSVKTDGFDWYPHYRNEQVRPSSVDVEFFRQMLHCMNNGKVGLIELKPVSTFDKLDFLNDFVNQYVQNPELKDILRKELDVFDDSSELNFKADLRTMEIQSCRDFDREKTLFAFKNLKRRYDFLDLNQVLEVVW